MCTAISEPPDTVRFLLSLIEPHISMHSLEQMENALFDRYLEYIINSSDDLVILHKSLKEKIKELLYTISIRQKEVIELRFGLEDGRARTLEEIGDIFNLTRERIRQIEGKALERLRHQTRSRKLRPYL